MDLLKRTKELCKLYNITPARSKGQNFLVNENIYDKIVEAAELKSDDTVLEVGPGLGFLTAKLAANAGRVTAVELDDKLAGLLRTALIAQEVEKVEVINQNILDFDIYSVIASEAHDKRAEEGSLGNDKAREINQKYKVVANLPYNITSVFLRKFLSEIKDKPELMVLMLQKEVAERIVAKPGQMSLLAISVQFYAQAEIIQNVPASDFWPQPEVESAIIKIKIRKKNVILERNASGAIESPDPVAALQGDNKQISYDKEYEKAFFRLVKFGFSSKRKMLKNNLAGGYHLSQAEAAERLKKAGFNEKIRAQELSVEDWMKLLNYFES